MKLTPKRKSADTTGRLIKLGAAADALGFHIETLRVRIRRGELAAVRGAHGAYYLTPAQMASISPPRRSARRPVALESLDWTWYALARAAEKEGANYSQLTAIGRVRLDPALAPILHRLFTVKRLRLADLSSSEIADLTGLSARHVRRLTRLSLVRRLQHRRRRADRDLDIEDDEETDPGDDLEKSLHERLERRSTRAARRIVAGIQRRLEESGFRYHQRPQQPLDVFVLKRSPPAFKVKALEPEVIRHLLDRGLSRSQVDAIGLVGIGQDELNELILRGLPSSST